jgi:predicted transcriptional regulator YdeE
LWIQLDTEVQGTTGIETFEFPGGRYAVTTYAGFPNPQVWRQLWDWVQTNGYQWHKTNDLERIHNPNVTEAEIAFDFYLPIMD